MWPFTRHHQACRDLYRRMERSTVPPCTLGLMCGSWLNWWLSWRWYSFHVPAFQMFQFSSNPHVSIPQFWHTKIVHLSKHVSVRTFSLSSVRGNLPLSLRPVCMHAFPHHLWACMLFLRRRGLPLLPLYPPLNRLHCRFSRELDLGY